MQENTNELDLKSDDSNDSFLNADFTHTHESSQDKISISIENYRKLLQATVDLYKANGTIAKLESVIQKKDARITQLETQLNKKNYEGLSQVSFNTILKR